MRRWASLFLLLAAWMLAGCGQSQSWRDLAPTAEDAGLRLTVLVDIAVVERHPYREPIGGPSCLTYWIQVQSIDGARHQLRPDQFRVGSETPAQAIGQCNGEQMEPVWVDSTVRLLAVTVIVSPGHRDHLSWRPG